MKNKSEEFKGPILMVDDNTDWLDLMTSKLEENGYFVISYGHGDEAIFDIEEGLEYKVAIIDSNLRETEGHEVMKKSKEIKPTVKIISFSELPSKFQSKYADYCIMKPTYWDPGTKIFLLNLLEELL